MQSMLCHPACAIYGMLSSLGNLGDSTRLSTGASREASWQWPVMQSRLCNLSCAIQVIQSTVSPSYRAHGLPLQRNAYRSVYDHRNKKCMLQQSLLMSCLPNSACNELQQFLPMSCIPNSACNEMLLISQTNGAGGGGALIVLERSDAI